MTLTSLSFYLLVLALLVLYYLVPKRFQWVVLLIGSYAFYAFVCLRYMALSSSRRSRPTSAPAAWTP